MQCFGREVGVVEIIVGVVEIVVVVIRTEVNEKLQEVYIRFQINFIFSYLLHKINAVKQCRCHRQPNPITYHNQRSIFQVFVRDNTPTEKKFIQIKN